MNYSKSSMVGIGMGEGDLLNFSDLLHCKVENWPFRYLVLSFGGNSKSLYFWDPVVKNVQKKLIMLEEKLYIFGRKDYLD